MTVIALHTVNCDGSFLEGGRADGCEWWIAQASSASEARRVAAAAGWVRRSASGSYVRDLCPACAQTSSA